MASKKIYKVTGFEKVIVNGIEIASVPPTLNDCSWEQIQEYLLSGNLGDYFNIGDTKTIVLSTGEKLRMILASINDGSGASGNYYPNKTADFISYETTSNVQNYCAWAAGGNPYGYTSVSWPTSTVRNKLNDTIFPRLPLEVQQIIIPKKHEYAGVKNVGTTNVPDVTYSECSDKLWLPTASEMGLPAWPGEVYDRANKYKTYNVINNNSARIRYSGSRITSSIRVFAWAAGNKYTSDNIVIDSTGNSYSGVGLNQAIKTAICFRIG